MSNGELNGSEIPGSADEKTRCTIEALYEYNEVGSPFPCYSISSTSPSQMNLLVYWFTGFIIKAIARFRSRLSCVIAPSLFTRHSILSTQKIFSLPR